LRKIAVVGPLPPPYFGYSHGTAAFLKVPFAPPVTLVPFDTRLHDVADASGIGVSELQRAARHIMSFGAFLRREKPDLIVVFTGTTGCFWRDIVLMRIGARARIPTVVRFFGGAAPVRLRAFPAALRVLGFAGLRSARALLVETAEMADQFVEILPLVPARQFPNYVDLRDFPDVVPNLCARPPGVVYWGRMEPSKGVETVLGSVDSVCTEAGPVDFHFIGGDANTGYLDRFRNLASRSRFAPWIHVHGRMDRGALASVACACNVFAFPTEWAGEGQPTALLEAMILGLVPVSSPWRGVKEIVQHERNGLLVNPGDAVSLSSSICRLLRDHELRLRLASAAAETVSHHFDSIAAARRFYGILADLGLGPAGHR
jgi:glycosyltransferase involved in cell wall biosynthesis